MEVVWIFVGSFLLTCNLIIPVCQGANVNRNTKGEYQEYQEHQEDQEYQVYPQYPEDRQGTEYPKDPEDQEDQEDQEYQEYPIYPEYLEDPEDQRKNGPRCKPHKDASRLRLYAAAAGYDIWRSDQWQQSGDPGVRDEIFDFICSTTDKTTHNIVTTDGYYDFVEVRPDLRCSKSFSVETISTYSEYVSKMSASNAESVGASAEAEGGGFGVSFKASAKFSLSRNSEESKLRSLFEKSRGEVTLAAATCYTDDLTVRTFVRPKFAISFINGLKALNKTLSQSRATQESAMKEFINAFGTHFSKKVDLGAKMLYEQRFTSRSKNQKEAESRSRCSEQSAEACAGGGADVGVASASFEACVSAKQKECSSNSFDSSWGRENGLQSSRTLTIGSGLSDHADWGKTGDFKPVPIKYKLALISDLFKPQFVSKSDEYGFSADLDAVGIKTLFTSVAIDYCSTMLGRSKTECSQDFKGCGLNDDCRINERCINKPTSPNGYVCIGCRCEETNCNNCCSVFGTGIQNGACRNGACGSGGPFGTKEEWPLGGLWTTASGTQWAKCDGTTLEKARASDRHGDVYSDSAYGMGSDIEDYTDDSSPVDDDSQDY